MPIKFIIRVELDSIFNFTSIRILIRGKREKIIKSRFEFVALPETSNCAPESFKYEWNFWCKIKIILHRIISVVNLTSFFTRNLDSIHPRWRVTTLTSEREAGGECNRLGGLYSRPLMNVTIAIFKWRMEKVSVFWVVADGEWFW